MHWRGPVWPQRLLLISGPSLPQGWIVNIGSPLSDNILLQFNKDQKILFSTLGSKDQHDAKKSWIQLWNRKWAGMGKPRVCQWIITSGKETYLSRKEEEDKYIIMDTRLRTVRDKQSIKIKELVKGRQSSGKPVYQNRDILAKYEETKIKKVQR